MLLSPHSRDLANGMAMTHRPKKYCKRTSIRSMRPAIPETSISTLNIRTVDLVLRHGGFQSTRLDVVPQKETMFGAASCLKEPR